MWLLFLLTFTISILDVQGTSTGPAFTQTSYSATVGLNTTVGTTLATLLYNFSDPNEVVTFSMDPAIDGYSYFGFSGDNVILATGLDVEYGATVWAVRILAIDNGTMPETATASLTLTTYQSTTTTTTTPAPPGYSWFHNQDNVILFGAFFGFLALLTGIFILLCFRFHRIGTCLPRSCPEYRQCRASARRQCKWCPIPCVYNEHVPIKTTESYYEDNTESTSSLSRKAGVSESTGPTVSTVGLPEKEQSTAASDRRFSKTSSERKPSKGPTPLRSVTPVSIGNVDFREAGFDGMRTPGFNAPMFTSYGGSNGPNSIKKKKRKF